MNTWTPEAINFLNGYLQQVSALAQSQGEEAGEISEQLRDHVEREVERTGVELVTLEHVRLVLRALGTPEEVLGAGREELQRRAAALSQPAPPVRTAPPPLREAMPPSRVVQTQPSSFSRSCLMLSIAAAIGIFLILPIVGIVSAITLPALSRAREAARRASCQNNLKQIALKLQHYETEHGALPPYSGAPGELMFAADVLGEDALTLLQCPSAHHAMTEGDVLDRDYIYFPFRAVTPEEIAQVSEQYAAALRAEGRSGPLPLTAIAPPVSMVNPVDASETPILIERLGVHIPSGANVLYLDGHVEFHREGTAPVTQEFFQHLAAAEP